MTKKSLVLTQAFWKQKLISKFHETKGAVRYENVQTFLKLIEVSRRFYNFNIRMGPDKIQ